MFDSVFLQYFYSGLIGYTTAIFSYPFYSADKIKFNYKIILTISAIKVLIAKNA